MDPIKAGDMVSWNSKNQCGIIWKTGEVLAIVSAGTMIPLALIPPETKKSHKGWRNVVASFDRALVKVRIHGKDYFQTPRLDSLQKRTLEPGKGPEKPCLRCSKISRQVCEERDSICERYREWFMKSHWWDQTVEPYRRTLAKKRTLERKR